jgi:hypothetical protein
MVLHPDFSLDPTAYGPVVGPLLAGMPLAPLGPGRPVESARAVLAALRPEDFAPPGSDADMAAACRAGLWLGYNFLDESHAISQELHTTTGSYWHALMHRREPDHSNAAYWLRRVGQHPIFNDLARVAAELGYAGKDAGWDAFAFNDACERHRGKGDQTEELLRRVQRAEWELLFAWCYHRAIKQG